uniref:Uncharacterized protein n=1 Tax=Ananas comosus var. bracteatus TaxID=296719 RepID=A0A6V7PEU6_ANACO|nr:unnamed protein product [Ananas comosus var. bracteatus]
MHSLLHSSLLLELVLRSLWGWGSAQPHLYTSIMGVAGRERGVLKLVHPGGFVEVHRRPMAAAEVIARNPRHSVADPRVFKNPRLVLRPDAQLNTSDVFYIVPNCTLYRLLRASHSIVEY